MVQENGAAEITNLSEVQLKLLNAILSSYLQEKRTLEARIAVINKMISELAGAYLAGLGLNQNQDIDLVTGKLTPVAAVPARAA